MSWSAAASRPAPRWTPCGPSTKASRDGVGDRQGSREGRSRTAGHSRTGRRCARAGAGRVSVASTAEGRAVISEFFIDRPIFANVIALITVIIGGVFFYRLPVAQYPEIVPPTIQVSTRYPGASAEVVA